MWHSGGLFSYVSLMWLFPDDGDGVFASVNGPGLPNLPSYGLKVILSYVSDLALGFKPWLDLDTACSFPSPWKNLTDLPIGPLKKYQNDHIRDFEGIYGSKLLPDIHIKVTDTRDRGSHLSFQMNRLTGELLPTEKNDTFNLQFLEPFEYAIERKINDDFSLVYPTIFQRDAQNNVVGFNVTFLSSKDIMEYTKGSRFLNEDNITSGSGFVRSSLLCGLLCLCFLVFI